MQLGKVVGRVVCSQRIDEISSMRLLIVQPMDPERRPTGKPVVAADAVNAGQGEIIYFVGGTEAAMAFDYLNPLDLAVVGIADSIGIGGRIIEYEDQE